jgi:D-beta-D-heptose 7-phosphate kinase/D-beta-D-heptose 1-phosphate adenosyltransferase
VVTGPELALALSADERLDRGVVSPSQLADSVALARQAGEKIVFTNGCFDILHAGHVAYLREARELGSRLVVAINSDASVTRLKGPGRPVNPLHQRALVLSGLASVDWVVGFEEDTPEQLLAMLKPDVLVKGGDYDVADVVGGDIVAGYGGEVRVLSLVEDVSTTAIVDRIQGGD